MSIQEEQNVKTGVTLTSLNDVQLLPRSSLDNFFNYCAQWGEIKKKTPKLFLFFSTKEWKLKFLWPFSSRVSWKAQQCVSVNHPRSHLDWALSARWWTELNQADGVSLRAEALRVYLQNKSVTVRQAQSASVWSLFLCVRRHMFMFMFSACPLEVKDALIRIWRSKVKDHCDLTKHLAMTEEFIR